MRAWPTRARCPPRGEPVLPGTSAAIAAIPEEPPVLLAVILGLGAYRLLKRGVLVRRLNAEEVLGAIDLIVTDKTGTPTVTRRGSGPERLASGAPEAVLAMAAVDSDAERDAWQAEIEAGAAAGER